MVNLTLSVDEQTLRRARIRALEQGTSVNAVVRDFLDSYAADRDLAMHEFLDIAARSEAGSNATGRTWTREDLYKDRVAWPRS